MPRVISFYDKLKAWPPCLVRLYAHDKSRPLTNTEIASRSGLSEYQVATLSFQTSWDGVPVDHVRHFTSACGLDFCDPVSMERARVYMKSGAKYRHLRNTSDRDREFYKQLVSLFVEVYDSK